jgi:hypothetical protein
MTVGLNALGSVEAHRLQHRCDVRAYVAGRLGVIGSPHQALTSPVWPAAMLACVGAQTPWRAGGRIVASGLAREPQSPVADQAMARRLAPGPSAKLLGKHDDDPLRAADIAEPVTVFVALHPTKELRAAGLQPGDGGVDVIDGKGDTADT